MESLSRYMMSALVFSGLGIVILIVAMVIFDRLTPGHMWKEIVEEKNLPLALTASATILSVAIIIASAIRG